MARRSDERDAARAEYIARMEKDGEVNLRQLADDLHLKYDTVRRWKAKDGWDPPAPRKPGGQPGNKNAVGNPGGGAPVGNENAMKDGAYATIFFDKLTPEEKQIVENAGHGDTYSLRRQYADRLEKLLECKIPIHRKINSNKLARDRRRARQCRCIYKKQHKALSFSVSQNTRPAEIMPWA